MLLSEYRNGGICHCHNTKKEEYATVRIQKRRNMPSPEYRNGIICHFQNTEMEESLSSQACGGIGSMSE
jgi:hypothetical protein